MWLQLVISVLCSAGKECRVDSDCWATKSTGFASLFCNDKRCEDLRPGGTPCTHPRQCASFPFYGPAACSMKCPPSRECYGSIYQEAVFCCRPIPQGGECRADRPGVLSGCARGQKCMGYGGERGVCAEGAGRGGYGTGIFLSISGNLLINTGVNVQKLSYGRATVSYHWLTFNTMTLGTLIYVAGKVLTFTAYLFGSQSILAGLSGIGLVSNSILAPLINNEKFTGRDGLAIAFVLTGTVSMLINTSNSHHRVSTPCELFRMYRQTRAVLWFSSILLLILALYLLVRYVEVNSSWRFPDDESHFLRSNRFFHETGFVCRCVMVYLYVILSALIASFSGLAAKSLGELVIEYKRTNGSSGLSTIIFFLLLLFFFTFGQIYWLNRALCRYEALLVVPLFHVTWTVLSISTAGIYFRDFDHYSTSQFRWFVASIGIIFCGSVLLALRIIAHNRIQGRELDGSRLRVSRAS